MKRNETSEERATRKKIELFAFEATIGAGNDSETVDYQYLESRLGRKPTEGERHDFYDAWNDNLQQMANP